MFSYTKDSNKFFVDTESEEEDLASDKPLFILHDTVEHEGLELDEESYRLSEPELSQYAKTASKLRADFEKKAQDLDE